MPSSAAGSTKSGDSGHGERHLAILRHVALYRLTFRRAVYRAVSAVPDESTAGTALSRLVFDGMLVSHDKANKEALPGGTTYYTLSARGAKTAGVPANRSDPFKEALYDHLAALWFCCLSGDRRYRLEPAELEELLGGDAPRHNTTHCVAAEPVGHRLYRLYRTGTDAASAVKQVREYVEEECKKPSLRDWIRTREYGFAILSETPEMCRQLRTLIQKGTGGERPLIEDAHVVAAVCPGPATFKQAHAALGGRDAT